MNQQNDKLLNILTRITPMALLKVVVISLVEQCNLKCWGCDHCAPLADESFLAVDEFEKDMKRLAGLAAPYGGVTRIVLLGGEPLLHPDIKKFTEISRKYFPEARIEIFTNGILLIKQSDDFWENCRNHKIVIKATKYPLKIDWDAIIKKAKSLKNM